MFTLAIIGPAQRRQVHALQSARRQEAGVGRRSARRHARPPRGRRQAGRPALQDHRHGRPRAGRRRLAARPCRAQTEAAILLADAILFVVDARAGVTPDDRAFAALVRRAGKPLILLANKAEGRAGGDGAMEAYDLGLGDPVPFSAEHGEGLSELYSTLLETLPEQTAAPEDDAAEVETTFDDEEDGTELDLTKPLAIAIVGRPNAGKSTLLNHILGEQRLLTGPRGRHHPRCHRRRAGMARAGAEDVRHGGAARRARVEDKLEKLAGADALRAAKFAEVVILLVDATAPFEKQDLTLADLVAREDARW